MFPRIQEYSVHPKQSTAKFYRTPGFPKELGELIQKFKTYYLARPNSHTTFGKDCILHKPFSVVSAAICHTHVFSELLSQQEQQQWVKSKNNSLHRRGSSDSMIIYAVSSVGNVYLLAFYEDGAHENINNNNILTKLVAYAETAMAQNSEEPMSQSKLLALLSA